MDAIETVHKHQAKEYERALKVCSLSILLPPLNLIYFDKLNQESIVFVLDNKQSIARRPSFRPTVGWCGWLFRESPI